MKLYVEVSNNQKFKKRQHWINGRFTVVGHKYFSFKIHYDKKTTPLYCGRLSKAKNEVGLKSACDMEF